MTIRRPGWAAPRRGALRILLPAVAGALAGCAAEPVSAPPLGACREDLDCPGRMLCIAAPAGGGLGTCGCSDVQVAAEDAPLAPSRYCPGAQVCVGFACVCQADWQCPGRLRCDPETRISA